MTALEKWKNDFKEFISELSIPRDDYKGIMEYINEVPNEASEQQPCDDCISRQAVEKMIKAEAPERGMWEIEGDTVKETVCEVCADLMQELSKLPPVTPKEKTAAWVPVDAEPHDIYECNACGWLLYYEDTTDYKYCPNCGAKMSEPQESEDKE